MWSGAINNIPFGWLLCNGLNDTPDLRDRFIVGAGNNYGVGTTGGEATHTLSVAELPSHNHTFIGTSHTHGLNLSGLMCSSAGEHNHGYMITASVSNNSGMRADIVGAGIDAVKLYATLYTNNSGNHTHSISGTGSIDADAVGGSIGNTGSSYAHENRPPYYALCFIMKS